MEDRIVTADPERVQAVFLSAVELISTAERADLLDRECGSDMDLRRRVEALLLAHDAPDSVLDRPFVSPRPAPEAVPAPPTAATEPLTAGETEVRLIGPYKLLQPVGEGGMGIVYVAEQTAPVRRRVALKVIKAGMDSRQVLARFEAERQALALMDHPNIAKVLDAGATPDGRPYFVMELVKGVPITQFCDERRLTPLERLVLIIPVCQAVQHAHQKGIIHRDLKPSNVLVGLYDGVPVPKVIDFGVAKATGQKLTEATLFTGFGAVIGTLEYMSPEQAQLDNLDVDTRSDVYSLGVLLYELLTGTTPLDRRRLKEAALVEVLRVIREEDPQRPSTRLSTTAELPSIAACRNVEPRRLSGLLRGELDWIVMKALEKDRNRRYETANSIAADLRRYLDDEPVTACPPSAWYRFRKFARRNRPALATMSVVAASLVALAALSVLYADRQRRFALDKAEAARKITDLAGDLKTSLAESNRLLAMRNFDRGQAAFEKGEIGPGLLWMIESWRSAIAADDPAWQHAARANLAAWQPHHPRLKAVLSHPSPVDAAAFSPDGKLVVTGSDDRTARLWDVATARQIGPPLRHEGEVMGVAFSPDGKAILTGSQDKTARLWDAASGKSIGPPLPVEGLYVGVAFSPNGKTILTSSRDMRLWDAATGQPIGQPLPHRGQLGAVAFSPDGKTFLSASAGGGARLWDTASGRSIGSLLAPGREVVSVAISPDGKTLLTGSQDATVQLWDADTGQPIGTPLKRHSGGVRGVAFSPDGKFFLTGSVDKTAQLWDAVTRQPIGRPLQHQGAVVGVAFSPDGKTFLTVSSDSTVKVWDADPGQPLGLIFSEESHASYAFSRDGKSVLNISRDRTARLRDAATGRPIGPPLPDPHSVWSVAISPDGKMLLTGSGRSGAQRWDAVTGRPIGQPLPHPGGEISIALSPDGKTIITGGMDHTVRLWDAATGEPLCKPLPQTGAVQAVAFSPDGKSFLAAYDIGAVQLWDLATLTPLGQPFPHPGWVITAAFSPDGKLLVTGCDDYMARIWEVATRTLLVPPLRHQGLVRDVAFSPDGKTVLTKSGDHTARLWDVATGVSVGRYYQHSSAIAGVAFYPDGKSFLLYDGLLTRRFRTVPKLPNDLERVATWVQVVTGLTLDPQRGAIQLLDNAAWLERRQRLTQLGGPPEMEADQRLDPILFGPDPTARARAWMERGRWDAAEAAFDEAVRARPDSAAIRLERGRFEMARGRPERAAAEFGQAIHHLPEDLQIRYGHVLSLLALGDEADLRRACSELLDRFGSSIGSLIANNVAWYCVLAPDAVADRVAPVRLAELAVNGAPEAQKPMHLNTLGAALYRAGRFQEAISRLEEGIRKRGGESSPQDWTFLALAHDQLGHHAEAHAWLDRLPAYRPNESDGAFWNELEIRLLRREAEAVILYDPIFPTDPFAN
jgi:WD40 repeat protein/serine/threonine protein kinase/tetratricopeptide (TPR) repeat protein